MQQRPQIIEQYLTVRGDDEVSRFVGGRGAESVREEEVNGN
jgi:hypothetical protein